MTNYEKGAKFERDIVNEFWGHGWAAVRSAGSGTIGFPVPDVMGVRNKRLIAIECKTTKKDRINLKKAALNLQKFSDIARSKAYIAVKFYREKPRFFNIKTLISGKTYTVSLSDDYLSLDSILGEQVIL